MEEECSSSPQNKPVQPVDQSVEDPLHTLTLGQGIGQEGTELHVSRSQLTPSPVLGLHQSRGASAAAKSPAASSTHSSLGSVEEFQSPGLAPSLHFLREAHNYLGRYVLITCMCGSLLSTKVLVVKIYKVKKI